MNPMQPPYTKEPMQPKTITKLALSKKNDHFHDVVFHNPCSADLSQRPYNDRCALMNIQDIIIITMIRSF